MKNILQGILIFISLMYFSNIGYADKGMVVPSEAVNIAEPGQKAIIMHNGNEEILILATDVKSSSPTSALSFIPLPSEPEASLSPKNCFDALMRIIKRHQFFYAGFRGENILGMKGEGAVPDEIELRFHKKLGPHDITGIKINDAIHFRDWVNNYFKQKGLPQQKEYTKIEGIVDDYVKRDIRYFVFDFVELEKETVSIEPVTYKFKTAKPYYPLKTSNMFTSDTNINLFFITPVSQRFSRQFVAGKRPGILPKGWQGSSVASLNFADIKDLMDIYPGIIEFFNNELTKHFVTPENLGYRGAFPKDKGNFELYSCKYRGKLNFSYDIFNNEWAQPEPEQKQPEPEKTIMPSKLLEQVIHFVSIAERKESPAGIWFSGEGSAIFNDKGGYYFWGSTTPAAIEVELSANSKNFDKYKSVINSRIPDDKTLAIKGKGYFKVENGGLKGTFRLMELSECKLISKK